MTKRMTPILFVALLVVGTQLLGCGVYSASSGRVDESIKRVAVQYLENNTAEPNLGVDLS